MERTLVFGNNLIQIPRENLDHLQTTLKDIIHDGIIILPLELINLCHILPQLTASVFVNQQVGDKLIWKSIVNNI